MAESAMILAAGFGIRMRPLTNTLPKPLISVAGKTMLARAFEHLQHLQIPNVVVNTHYLASLIEDYIKTHHPSTLISHEEILLETGGGIKKALPLLGKQPFFTLNGDSIWTRPESLKSMEEVWNKAKMDALLLILPREKAHGYEGRGDFFMSGNGRLTRLGQAPEAPYVYIGVQLVAPHLFHDAPEGPFSMNFLWDKALKNDRLYGYVHKGECFHISTPEDLKKYEPVVARL